MTTEFDMRSATDKVKKRRKSRRQELVFGGQSGIFPEFGMSTLRDSCKFLNESARWTQKRVQFDRSSLRDRSSVATERYLQAVRRLFSANNFAELQLYAALDWTARQLVTDLITGLWTEHCADEFCIALFECDFTYPPVAQMVSEIESRILSADENAQPNTLSWNALRGLRDVGLYQFIRLWGAYPAQDRYSEAEVTRYAILASLSGLLAAALIGELTENEGLLQKACKRIQSGPMFDLTGGRASAADLERGGTLGENGKAGR